MERRFERADTAYSPSGRSWREELELENGWQIPLLFLLYFVAKNKNQPQRTVDDRSERFGGFWGEAFGHRRRYPRLTAGGGAKVRARGYGVFAEGSPRRSLRPPQTPTTLKR